GVADRHDRIPDIHRGTVTERDRLQSGDSFDLQQGDVVDDVVAEDVRRVAGTGGGDLHRDVGGPVDDVVVGQQQSGGGQHHACTRGLATIQGQRDVDHRRVDERH